MNQFTLLSKFQQKSILILKHDTRAAFNCMQDESLPWLGTTHFSQSWIDNAGYSTLFFIHTMTKYNLLKKYVSFFSPVVAWVPLIHGGMQHSDTQHKVLQNVIVWIHGGMQRWYFTQSITKRNCLKCQMTDLSLHVLTVSVCFCQYRCVTPSLSFPFDQGSGKHFSSKTIH